MLDFIFFVTGREEVISCSLKLGTNLKMSIVLPPFFPLPGTCPWLVNFLWFGDCLLPSVCLVTLLSPIWVGISKCNLSTSIRVMITTI